MSGLKLRPRALPLALLALVWCAGGCGRRETPVTEGISTRTLLVGNSAEPADLDPHLAEAYTDQILLVALHEGLTVLDERTSRPLPASQMRTVLSLEPDAMRPPHGE